MPLMLARVFLLAASLTAAFPFSASSQDHEATVMLLDAARTGNLDELRSAISKGADLDARAEQGRTALLLAIRANHIEVASALIAAGADVNAKDAIHDTPFLYAAAEGRVEILKLILATGKADLKDTNRYGGTALIPAADRGHVEAVRMLLDTKIDIDHVNDLGWTALLEAVILGDGGTEHQKIVDLLVDAGAKNIPDREGITPLDHARQRGFNEMVARIKASPQK